ncbi:MAG: hypothetical protein DCF30_10225 [Hyphomicrobiales bacterium]|nr:MAG: hypothetical protein DCF30_10225 [Hyphomicrobiales bacterium]
MLVHQGRTEMAWRERAADGLDFAGQGGAVRRSHGGPSVGFEDRQEASRHCEERSDEAIQGDIERLLWIASLRSQ